MALPEMAEDREIGRENSGDQLQPVKTAVGNYGDEVSYIRRLQGIKWICLNIAVAVSFQPIN